MAKKTFENLEKEKKEKIYNSLKEFFEEEDLKNVFKIFVFPHFEQIKP